MSLEERQARRKLIEERQARRKLHRQEIKERQDQMSRLYQMYEHTSKEIEAEFDFKPGGGDTPFDPHAQPPLKIVLLVCCKDGLELQRAVRELSVAGCSHRRCISGLNQEVPWAPKVLGLPRLTNQTTGWCDSLQDEQILSFQERLRKATVDVDGSYIVVQVHQCENEEVEKSNWLLELLLQSENGVNWHKIWQAKKKVQRRFALQNKLKLNKILVSLGFALYLLNTMIIPGNNPSLILCF